MFWSRTDILMKGLVIKNTGSWYTVLTDDGQELLCKVKGNFRIRKTNLRPTNPVAIGDRVEVEEGTSITSVCDRRNYIIRRSQNLSRQCHILAANVDQAVLIVTVAHPETSTTFVDRFLASAEAYDVPVILLFNKTDLLNDEERQLQQYLIDVYTDIGYTCIPCSAINPTTLEPLLPLLQGRITLLSGNSGVGKSTLLNNIIPGLNIRTAPLSEAHDTGQHTTTFSTMYPLSSVSDEIVCSSVSSALNEKKRSSVPSVSNEETCSSVSGWVIDTPGIKGFGTLDFRSAEVSHYFPDIFRLSKGCRFSDCTHTHEPGCAVLDALEDHRIAPSRYASYLSILEDREDDKYRPAF